MTFEVKDIITLCASGASVLISLAAFLFTFRQRSREIKRATRAALTDTLAAISRANIEMVNLRKEAPSSTNTDLRRNYNSQRRYLANHAHFLVEEIPELTADIDHSQLAGAFNAAGDYGRAHEHWRKCIAKSPNDEIHMYNLRGYARFLCDRGDAQNGRRVYEQALLTNLPDTDRTKSLRADTYLLWSLAERYNGFLEEARRRRDQAVAEAQRIGQSTMREEQLANMAAEWRHDPGIVLSALVPASETPSAT